MLTKLAYQTARITFHGDAVRVTRGSSTIGTLDEGSTVHHNGGESEGVGTFTDGIGNTTTTNM
jgi:hypothetical protein